MVGQHLASLNLFLEADGKLYVTCASADIRTVILAAEDRGLVEGTPADKVIALVAKAENVSTAIRQSIVDNISALVERREANKQPQQVTEAVKAIGLGVAEGRY